MKTKRTRSAILLTLLMTAAVLFAWALTPQFAWAEGSGAHYIAVASDRHNTPDAIRAAMGNMPDSVEYVCLNGDMTDFAGTRTFKGMADGSQGEGGNGGPGGMKQLPYNTSTVLNEVLGVFPHLDADHVSIVYGSHDANATDDAGIMRCIEEEAFRQNDTQSDFAEISAGKSGCIFTGMDGDTPAYYIYGVSYYDMMDAGKGKDGSAYGQTAEAAAAAFMQFADEHPDVPLIVIGHVPIHATRGDNLGASYWNAALNYAATGSEDGTTVKRNVVYLHGHNHTREIDTTTGKAIEYFVEPGKTLTVQGTAKEESAESTIYYTYATAGYLKDNLKATLIKVENGGLSFEKYSGCKVDFDTGSDGNKIKTQNLKSGDHATEPPIVYRGGYDFTGWYADEGCTEPYEFDMDPVTVDKTIYAGWQEEWNVASIEFRPASDTVLMSQIREVDNDGKPQLNLANRGINSSMNQYFFVNGDSVIVNYKDGSSREYFLNKKRGNTYADFKAADGDVIQIEILASELSKEIRNSEEGSADELAAAIGSNELTAEYRDLDINRYVLDGFTLTVEEDEQHECRDCLRTCNRCEPGCDNTGISGQCCRCQICNRYYSDFDAKHEISRASVLLPALGHQWDKGTVTVAPDSEGEGVKVFRCTRSGCRQSYKESVGMTGHEYSPEWTSNERSHWHDCTEEGSNLKDSYGTHRWVPVIKQASCTGDGAKAYECEICGAIQPGTMRVIPAEGHQWDSKYTVDKKATYAAAGSKSIHCSACGAIKEGSKVSIPKLVVKRPVISGPAAGRKSLKVKWKKQSGASGFEIQCALNRKFTKGKKRVIVKKASASAKKVTKLKGGKKYYVRIRAYRIEGGRKYYSKWSQIKTKKTKK